MRLKRTILFTVSLLLLAAVISALPPRIEFTRADLLPAIAVQERHANALMALPDVVGIGAGASGNSPVIKVFLQTGYTRGLPRRLDGITVVPEVVGEIFALRRKPPKGPKNPPADPTTRFDRPVPIGVSTGHPDITAGTIGCRVTDGTDVYALSNNHIYANENRASIGDAVIQPGTFDGGSSPGDDIGTLFDFEPIVFSISADNKIDAAIATSTTALLGNSTPSDGYGTPLSTTIGAAVRMRVMKYGRTTSQTKGRIDAINATVNVGYDSGVARFVNQIIIRPGSFSAGGDSGSLIVVERGRDKLKPVGLLFAGSSLVTIANPIDAVLNRFGVTVDGD